jgi:hypothetical protein
MSTRSLRRGPTRDRRCHVKFFGPRPARSQFLRGTQVQGRVRRSFRRTTNSQFLPRFRWVAILAPRTRIYGKLAEFRVVLPLRGTNFGVFFGALWQQIRPSWRWAYSLGSRFCGGGGRNRTGVHGFAGRCMTTLPPRRTKQNGERIFPRECDGAGKEARTPDLNLGKVALYQLSYSRTQPANYRN